MQHLYQWWCFVSHTLLTCPQYSFLFINTSHRNQFLSYKNVFDGLFRIYKEEGVSSLFRGTVPAVTRAILLTIGTNAAYDQVKQMLKNATGAKDGVPLHFATSTIAGCIATVITQPLDVIKTTFMNAKPGEFSGIGGRLSQHRQAGSVGLL